MSPLEGFPQEQTDAPSDSGALRLNLSGGGLCWRLPFCRAELHRATLLYGQDPEEHCLRLLAHGLGHLAGYDHGPEMDELCSEMLSAAEAWLTAQ